MEKLTVDEGEGDAEKEYILEVNTCMVYQREWLVVVVVVVVVNSEVSLQECLTDTVRFFQALLCLNLL